MSVIPEYTLRYSKKAKYLQLRVSSKGLEVVVPFKKKIALHHIHEFILQKKDWIVETQQRCEKQPKPKLELPTSINLKAINQTWEVLYFSTQQKRIVMQTNPARQIKFVGDIANQEYCIRLLRHWLKTLAEHHLCDMLRRVSLEFDISFHQVTIRNNTTRWGSCTSKKNISLCCRLLFLPEHLVQHVLLHELCHTRFMNHGKHFWGLLRRLDPHCDTHIEELKRAVIPDWVKSA